MPEKLYFIVEESTVVDGKTVTVEKHRADIPDSIFDEVTEFQAECSNRGDHLTFGGALKWAVESGRKQVNRQWKNSDNAAVARDLRKAAEEIGRKFKLQITPESLAELAKLAVEQEKAAAQS